MERSTELGGSEEDQELLVVGNGYAILWTGLDPMTKQAREITKGGVRGTQNKVCEGIFCHLVT